MSDSPGKSIRDVVAPLWRELSTSLSGLGLASNRRQSEDDTDRKTSNINVGIPPAMQTPVPNTSVLQKSPQIVAGVLFKHVNIAVGWRPRLFILHNGVLQYYKIYGPTAINVHTLLDSLRQQGEVYLIGAEISVLENQYASQSQQQQQQRLINNGNVYTNSNVAHPETTTPTPITTSTSIFTPSSGSTPPPPPNTPLPKCTIHTDAKTITTTNAMLHQHPPPSAEIHMQVATLRESKADGRKFYINSGTTTLTLRSETQDDRWAWVEALRAAKGAWDGLTPVVAGALKHRNEIFHREEDHVFDALIEEARSRLLTAGIDKETLEYILEMLRKHQQHCNEIILDEVSKRQVLLDLIYQLENDKRELETAVVVENRNWASSGGGASAASPTRTVNKNKRHGEEGDGEEEEGLGEGGEDEVEEAEFESEVDDEFFDCEILSLRSGSGSGHSRSASLNDLLAMLEPLPAVNASATTTTSPVDNGAEYADVDLTGKSRHISKNLDDSLLAAAATTTTTTTTSSKASPQQTTSSPSPPPKWLTQLSQSPPPQRRDRLPVPMQQEKSISLWSLIKEMIGKDLTRVCLPVYFNEPLSALQKTAEDMEYSELLDEAARCPPRSIDRLLWVSAFAISPYSSTAGRTSKPFNPLLGETYELVHKEKGFRFIAEKVSHHPTIIAAYAEGRSGWTYEGDAEVKSRFWGRFIELKPEGAIKLTFADGDAYTWNKVTTSINNLVLGKIYIDHGGIMKIQCMDPESGGLTARIRFKETGLLFDKDPRQLRGFIEKDGVKLERPLLHGHWDDALYAEMDDGRQIELWKKAPPPPDPTRYNLTAFAIQLNEMTEGLERCIAPTDCRLRPDQLYTEKGMWDEANKEKQRLEHKQRAARAAAERGEPLMPRWFDIVPSSTNSMIDISASGSGFGGGAHSNNNNENSKEADAATMQRKMSGNHHVRDSFRYKGGYWEAREKGEFDGCREIFGS